jgi:hypothetical protein
MVDKFSRNLHFACVSQLCHSAQRGELRRCGGIRAAGGTMSITEETEAEQGDQSGPAAKTASASWSQSGGAWHWILLPEPLLGTTL